MRNGRAVATYVGFTVLLVVALLTLLPAGREIVPANQASPIGRVGGGAAACLGEYVAAVQSGVFLELHTAGQAAEASDGFGATLMGGRLDRETSRGVLTGTCAAGSALGEVPASMAASVTQDGTIEGVLTTAGQEIQVVVAPAEVEDAAGDVEPLDGGHLIARLLLAVAVVIVAARLLGWLFGRIRQPRVIGEIVAGIALGPSLLGLFAPEVTGYLFPPEVTSVLGVLAQFGLILFMFLIGLELDHAMIRGSGRTAVLVSHSSIILPFVLGLVAALIVYPLVGSGQFSGFALFMGAAMSITAFPVLARILTDTGLHRTRLGALAITAAAVDDVTAWCILAVVVAIVNASGVADAVWTVLLASGFVVVMFLVVRPLLGRVAAVHANRGRLAAPIMSGLIVAVFLAAWATEMIGIHAIFGAFLLGAILPRSRPLTRQITERLEDITVLFLLPVFFAVVGLSTRIGLVSGSDLWLVAALIIGIAIAGKLGGSVIAGRAAGESWRSATALGILMNSRGITEIVILTIGRSLGVISPALFTIMVLMALVTTFMTTPLLSVVYPKRLIEEGAAPTVSTVELRAVEAGSRRVMVGVTDPVAARPLLRIVTSLAGNRGQRATAVLTRVIQPPGYEQVRANLTDMDDMAAEAAAALGTVVADLRQQGVDAEIATAVGTDPGAELVRLAAGMRPGLLLVGSHEAYLGFRPLGGVAGVLLDTADCDVAVLVGVGSHRAPTEGPIGVWYRGEPPDIAPLDLAASLARGQDRPLRVISPVPVDLPELGVDVEACVLDEPTVSFALEAVEGTSVMVVAPPGVLDGALPALREAVIERASVPVLVVRGRLHAAPSAMTESDLSVEEGAGSSA